MSNPFHSIRQQYEKGTLHENRMEYDPLIQLGRWVADAIAAECPEPAAMVLSTTGRALKPSSRVVLMKSLEEGGITFFTNYDSRKGQQLLDNPQASLLFFWPGLERQVRIEGIIDRVPEEESDVYFGSRPEASRISAIISPQSREIPNREWLEERRQVAVETHNCVNPGSRPKNWGGYRLIPDYFEFWQGREHRLHDRIRYQPDSSGWRISRLAP